MNKILISGISGFVGINLEAFLKKKGHTVASLSRNTDNTRESFTWEDLSRLQGHDFDTYIHLAGKAHDLKNTSNPREYFDINTGLTKQLFEVFLESKATTFIYFSSVKAVADKVDGVLTENVVPSPLGPYGESKLKAEEYLLAQLLPPGKRLFIMRPCMIHGPGNKGNLNLLYKFVKKGIPYPLAGYTNERSFLSVDNLSFIVEKIVGDDGVPGGVYNLADDVPLSTNAVIRIIAGVNGSKPRLWKINPRLINFLAGAGDKLHLPLNSERLKKLTESYVVSNKKIKEVLSINQLALSSEDGLKLTIQSFSN